MNIQRLVNLLIFIALLAAIFLTVREAAATTDAISQADSVRRSVPECTELPSRNSIRTEYDSKRNAWLTVSEDGPTGMDGGLVQLLSDYRTCSK